MSADATQVREKIRVNLDNEVKYRHAFGGGTAPICIEHADGNTAYLCDEGELRALLSRAQPERRTETYPHDCGCETCPDHTHPATPTASAPQVTEAMVEAAMQEFCAQQGESYSALISNASDADKAEMRDDWRHILTAALSATPETGR